jgi:hypothetical protein
MATDRDRLYEAYDCYRTSSGCWIPRNAAWNHRLGRPTEGNELLARRVHRHFAGDPGDLWVCHDCGDRRCINPDHLYAGTAQDNADDTLRHGTRRRRVDHETIRRLRQQGYTYPRIATIMDCSEGTVSHALRHAETPITPPRQTRGYRHDHAEIIRLHRLGWPKKRIAREVGCAPANVRYAIRQAAA